MRRRVKEKPTALVKAVDLLAQQEHSEARLREKLIRRDYAAEEIDEAVTRLKEKHYLNAMLLPRVKAFKDGQNA